MNNTISGTNLFPHFSHNIKEFIPLCLDITLNLWYIIRETKRR